MFTMVFACDTEGGIGKDGDLPWRQSSDLQHFKQITMNKTIVMGRKTWDSLPKALPGRRNIVMSRTPRDDVEVLDYEAILALGENEEIMIMGGGEIYALFMEHTKEIHKTIINTVVDGADTFAPSMDGEGFHLIGERLIPAGPRDEHEMIFQHWIR
jgi:dihydrofolate reductase